MAQRINEALNSIPSGYRDVVEFAFFCGVGFTFGSLGIIWSTKFFAICKSNSRANLSHQANDCITWLSLANNTDNYFLTDN